MRSVDNCIGTVISISDTTNRFFENVFIQRQSCLKKVLDREVGNCKIGKVETYYSKKKTIASTI